MVSALSFPECSFINPSVSLFMSPNHRMIPLSMQGRIHDFQIEGPEKIMCTQRISRARSLHGSATAVYLMSTLIAICLGIITQVAMVRVSPTITSLHTSGFSPILLISAAVLSSPTSMSSGSRGSPPSALLPGRGMPVPPTASRRQ